MYHPISVKKKKTELELVNKNKRTCQLEDFTNPVDHK